jgi:hypothetical protein
MSSASLNPAQPSSSPSHETTWGEGILNIGKEVADDAIETKQFYDEWPAKHILNTYRWLHPQPLVNGQAPLPTIWEKNIVLITQLFMATIPLVIGYFFLPTWVPLVFTAGYEITSLTSGRRWKTIDFALGASTGIEGLKKLCLFAKDGITKGIIIPRPHLVVALICLFISAYFFGRYAKRGPQIEELSDNDVPAQNVPQAQNPSVAAGHVQQTLNAGQALPQTH